MFLFCSGIENTRRNKNNIDMVPLEWYKNEIGNKITQICIRNNKVDQYIKHKLKV